MPRIPLFNDGNNLLMQAPNGAPSIQPGGNQNLRVPLQGLTSAVVGAAQDLGKAGQEPLLPYELADRSGDRAMGQAVMQAGEMLGQIAQKEQEAKSVTAINRAKLDTYAAAAALEEDKRQNPDPATWPELLQKRVDALRETHLTDSTPRGARDAIQNDLALWAIQTNAAVKSDAFKRTTAEAKQSSLLLVDKGVESMNLNQVQSAISDGVNRGYFTKTEGDSLAFKASLQIGDRARNDLTEKWNAANSSGDNEGAGLVWTAMESSGLWKNKPGELARLRVTGQHIGEAFQRDKVRASVDEDVSRNPRLALKMLGEKDVNGGWKNYPEIKDEGDRRTLTNIANAAVQTENNKTRTDLWRVAINKGVVPDSVLLAKEQRGEIDAGDVDALRRANRANQPPAPDETLAAFLRSASSYDPAADDITQSSLNAIRRNGMDAGLNQDQLKQLESALDGSIKARATHEGRAEAAVQDTIFDQVKIVAGAVKPPETNVLDSHLKGALADEVKLSKYGLDAATSKKIANLAKGLKPDGNKADGAADVGAAAALREFIQAAPAAVPFEQSGLTRWEYDKYATAAKAKPNGTVEGEITPAMQMGQAINTLNLQREFIGWRDAFKAKNNRAPSIQESQGWMNQTTQKFHDGRAWDGLFKTKPQTDMGTGQPKTAGEKPTASTKSYDEMPDGSLIGTASSYGYAGDDDNGFNSIGMKRGEQPWHSEHPTVALAPEVARKLGVSLPRYNKKTKEYDTSNSFVEIEAGGKKVRAIYDENGMYIDPRSMDKLVDLTPEASKALGLSVKNNAKVTVRKIA